jgi:hypothetical protein
METKFKKEKGFLYIIGPDTYVWAVPMKHNKTGVKHRVEGTKGTKQSGFKYLIGKDGFIARAKMKE